MKIGILTGGGDCPGLNAVIRAVVKSAQTRHHWEVIGIEEGYEGLRTPSMARSLGPAAIRGILPMGGTILGASSGTRSEQFKQSTEGKAALEAEVKKNMRALGLSCLIALGGDGTMRIAHVLHKSGVPVIGIPKTIDNDIPGTDLSFGFQTAVNTATEALDKLHSTAESHHRVMIAEVMGRYAGWIALEAGMAGGADVILIPEIPFHVSRICKKIQDRNEGGRRFSIVIVSEGARASGGVRTLLAPATGGAVERLGGIGSQVGGEIARCTGMDVRVTVLGHLQRGGSPCPSDRILATCFGVAAVEMIAKERFGEMVCLKGEEISSLPLAEASRKLKLVPPECPLVRTAEALGISLGRKPAGSM